MLVERESTCDGVKVSIEHVDNLAAYGELESTAASSARCS